MAVLVAHVPQTLRQSMREDVEQLKQMHQARLAAQQQEYETALRTQQRLREEARLTNKHAYEHNDRRSC